MNSAVPQSAAAMAVRDLRFAYPKTRRQPARLAVDNVSFEIPSGQLVAMLGPNGSGKSTLMKIVCGLLTADQGTVLVRGSTDRTTVRSHVGVVFQSDSLDPHMTVAENLRDYALLYGLSKSQAKEICDRELRRASLDEFRNAFVKTLSGGLKRRVDLCRAALSQPRILLLDEPTAGLDPVARERFLEQLIERQQHDPELAILLSTHLVDEAQRADRVLLMHNGRLVADDSPDALRRQAGALQITLHSKPAGPSGGTLDWRQTRDGMVARLNDQRADQALVLTEELLRAKASFSVSPPTLADVFEQLTGSTLSEPQPPVPHSTSKESAP